MIGLCLASGMSFQDIGATVADEIAKEANKGSAPIGRHMYPINSGDLVKELGDVGILLIKLCNLCFNLPLGHCVNIAMDKNIPREWFVDSDGCFWSKKS